MIFIVDDENQSSNLLKMQLFGTARFLKPYLSLAFMVSARFSTAFFIFSLLTAVFPAFGQGEAGHVVYDVR
ncbi:MAG: hypothetical protein ACKORE_00850, partial [Bacteroidota bacterium]